jgi:hypothetical protein
MNPVQQQQKVRKQLPASFNNVPALSSLAPLLGGGGDLGTSMSANEVPSGNNTSDSSI